MVNPAPWEIVEPALAVVQVPEGDAFDHVVVFVKEPEQRRILLGLFLFDAWRQAIPIGIEFGQFIPIFPAVRPPRFRPADEMLHIGFVRVTAVVLAPVERAVEQVDVDLGHRLEIVERP